jgi:hypothetical protein
MVSSGLLDGKLSLVDLEVVETKPVVISYVD